MSKKMWRLLKIMHLAAGNEKLKAPEMAERLGVSVRTFHRDRQLLEEAGLGVVFDGEGYSLAGEPFLPSVKLRRDEGLALMLTVQSVLDADSIPYSESLRGAFEKIVSGIPPHMRRNISRLGREIQIRQQPMVNMSPYQEAFDVLRVAIEEQQVVRADYMGRSDEEPLSREIEPLGIFQRWRAWYVVAHCRLRDDLRVFRIDRMSNVSMTEGEFVPRRDFDLDRFLQEAWLVEHGDVQEVRIRFSGEAARLVRELTWHPSQRIEEHSEDSLIMVFCTGGKREVADWVMSYGSKAEVLEPPSLRCLVAQKSAEISSVYKSD